jgi:hypothetical protein
MKGATTMRLWLLRRLSREPKYDVNDGFVIRAWSEDQARQLADRERADEGEGVWLSAARSSCEPLEQGGEPGVILIDFNAG